MPALKPPPLLLTSPHSGTKVPDQAPWLKDLTRIQFLQDLDLYVDELYQPAAAKWQIPFILGEWHRYAGDLNRFPTDVDAESVMGWQQGGEAFPRGFIWVYNTFSERILPTPISLKDYQSLVELIHTPFHQKIQSTYAAFRAAGFEKLYHLDLHSCPSLGTKEHRDPGEKRADVILSDQKGRSTLPDWFDIVKTAYQEQAGFKVSINWPYYGGRITESYGRPPDQNVIQVELNRGLYMNEATKEKRADFKEVQERLSKAVGFIYQELAKL